MNSAIYKKVGSKKELFHCLVFEWASYVTKAADMLKKHFPRCAIAHGVENFFSFLVDKIFKLHTCSKIKMVGNMASIFLYHVSLSYWSHILFKTSDLDVQSFCIYSSCTSSDIQQSFENPQQGEGCWIHYSVGL